MLKGALSLQGSAVPTREGSNILLDFFWSAVSHSIHSYQGLHTHTPAAVPFGLTLTTSRDVTRLAVDSVAISVIKFSVWLLTLQVVQTSPVYQG